MRSLMVMSFVCALFVAIVHANKDDASKRPRIPLPPTKAFLEDIVKQAKPETSEQAAARKAALPAHNQKMREAAAAAAERYKNSKPKWWGQRNREELPRSRVKLTEEQVEEIDRQKAASRAEDQADKIAMKHRGSANGRPTSPPGSKSGRPIHPSSSNGDHLAKPSESDGGRPLRHRVKRQAFGLSDNLAVRPTRPSGSANGRPTRPPGSESGSPIRPSSSDGDRLARPSESDGGRPLRPRIKFAIQ